MMAAAPLLALLATLAAGLLAGKPYIAFMQQWKLGQIIRDEGPQSHQKKSGTPSMGGWLILAPALLVLPVFGVRAPEVWLLAGTILGYTMVGWLDDYLIIKKRSNKGLSPRHKLLGQFAIGVFFAVGLGALGHGTTLLLPVTHTVVDLNWGYYALLVFIMVGTSNAVNLTDGLDGLASGTVAIALAGLALAFLAYMHAPYQGDTLVLIAALIGGCLGFLWYNCHPAEIFMGDTGSLGLGAAVAGVAVLGHMELWLIPLGAIFIAETLSVIIQVWYFKRTGGKRFFKMSPLHHHFELSGWQETQVVGRFYLAGTVLALLTVALL